MNVATKITKAAAALTGVRALSTASAIGCLALAVYAIFCSLSTTTPQSISVEWFPAIGLSLAFRLDAFSLFFTALIGTVGSAVFYYCAHYFSNSTVNRRCVALLIFFSLSMLGLVLADNLLLLFIFWEATSISSYLLIGTKSDDKKAREAALQALLVTTAGGMCLLVAIIFLFNTTGSLQISSLGDFKLQVQDSGYYTTITLLIAVAAFTKSAQFPFHFWLPGAMAAPSPVSAFLHSATMVKAGIYLLFRFNPMLGETALWYHLLTGVGGVTMLAAAISALTKTDLKALLAYTTLSALGMLTFLIGLGTSLALKAAIVFLLVHALYKAVLFLVAGIIEKSASTRDITQLQGLRRQLPLSWAAAALAGLSMCGLPPLLGFVGKELIYEAIIKAPTSAGVFLVVGFLTNALTITAALLAVLRPFTRRFGQRKIGQCDHAKSVSKRLSLGPLLLGICSLICGLFSGWLGYTLLEPSFQVIKGEPSNIKLKLWHGINPVLLLSILTLAVGALTYRFHAFFLRPLAAIGRPIDAEPFSRIYTKLLNSVLEFAAWQTRKVQNGNLNFYLTVILTFVSGLLIAALVSVPPSQLRAPVVLDFTSAGIALAACIGTLLCLRAQTLLEATLFCSIVGLSVTLLFVLQGAPDLSLTQFMVELLLLVLVVAVSARLPGIRPDTAESEKARDLLVATLFGASLSYFLLLAAQLDAHQSISKYFGDYAYTLAHGRNVVNVILVDFRALDTFGEITVLAIAVLGVAHILRTRKMNRTV